MNRHARNLVIAVFVISSLTGIDEAHIFAQSKPEAASADFGEFTSMKSEEIINEALKTGSVVIIISRLGKGDTRANLHRRRLHNARARLVDYSQRLAKEKVVTAIGDRVKGGGQVEYYVNGRLVYIVIFKPNQDFSVDCCDEDPLYYPWYKEGKRKRI